MRFISAGLGLFHGRLARVATSGLAVLVLMAVPALALAAFGSDLFSFRGVSEGNGSLLAFDAPAASVPTVADLAPTSLAEESATVLDNWQFTVLTQAQQNAVNTFRQEQIQQLFLILFLGLQNGVPVQQLLLFFLIGLSVINTQTQQLINTFEAQNGTPPPPPPPPSSPAK